MQLDRPLILLMENNEDDVFLFRRALAKAGFRGSVRLVRTLGEARRYLLNDGEFTDKEYYPRPDLIVSDMNVLGHTGNELFVSVRSNPELVNIPFVFLSGSYTPVEKRQAEELGADGFFQKTAYIDEAVATVRKILNTLDGESETPSQSNPAREDPAR
jgi:DNA-binding response OmpR family regulator